MSRPSTMTPEGQAARYDYVYVVPCEDCQAPNGQPCRRQNGDSRPKESPHSSRYIAYAATQPVIPARNEATR